MEISIITIFPEMFQSPLAAEAGLIGKALQKNIATVTPVDLKDFGLGKFNQLDDTPYGGGAGMVLRAEPLHAALQSVKKSTSTTILLSPQGTPLTQNLVKQLSNQNHLILLCGRYEGVDERICDHVDMEISLGDFVMTGGEIAALALIDAVVRLLPGVLGNSVSITDESHTSPRLEYPQYTKPVSFNGKQVPEILLSGHHANIEKWRKRQSILRTLSRRPDLLSASQLSDGELDLLSEK